MGDFRAGAYLPTSYSLLHVASPDPSPSTPAPPPPWPALPQPRTNDDGVADD